jgi:hypothetical protein
MLSWHPLTFEHAMGSYKLGSEIVALRHEAADRYFAHDLAMKRQRRNFPPLSYLSQIGFLRAAVWRLSLLGSFELGSSNHVLSMSSRRKRVKLGSVLPARV